CGWRAEPALRTSKSAWWNSYRGRVEQADCPRFCTSRPAMQKSTESEPWAAIASPTRGGSVRKSRESPRSYDWIERSPPKRKVAGSNPAGDATSCYNYAPFAPPGAASFQYFRSFHVCCNPQGARPRRHRIRHLSRQWRMVEDQQRRHDRSDQPEHA